MEKYSASMYERQQQRFIRWAELLRGRLLRLAGAHAGVRFGVGVSVRILYPSCFTAGDNVTISDFSFLHCLSQKGVRFGNFTSVDRNMWLHCGSSLTDYAHGFFEIGDHSYIGCNAVIGAGGGIRIGNHVLIGQSVSFHSENHIYSDTSKLISEQGVAYQGIIIEDDVWVGSKVTILDGVTIGCGAVIGAGALVNKSIPRYALAVGVPARVVKYREEPGE